MNDSLILDGGTHFEGSSFGSLAVPVVGEVVLYTGVAGWQEVLTDPAYAGTIVVFTYPHVGNYGANDEDVESSAATAKGVVVRDLARFHSNFRATGDLRSWMERRGLVGLDGVDTRAVMVHAREHGGGIGAIASSPNAGLKALREAGSPFEGNLVQSIQGICRWPAAGAAEHPGLGTPDAGLPLGVLDLGGKNSLYRQMVELGCALHFFPWDATAEAIRSSGVAGLLLPPGPGDPNRLGTVVQQVGRLLGRLPILGIGLGFQVLALALGGRVVRLKSGRHGVNYPVRSTRGEPSIIAACHHSFALEAAPMAGVEVTYVHLNEGTPMGLEASSLRARGYQFHPGRDADNLPSPLLSRFVADVSSSHQSFARGETGHA